MSMTKLTLTADRALIEQAKKLAEEEGTSLSALVSRMLRALASARSSREVAAPLTRKATGLIRLPEVAEDNRLLEDALAAKYVVPK